MTNSNIQIPNFKQFANLKYPKVSVLVVIWKIQYCLEIGIWILEFRRRQEIGDPSV